MKPCTAVAAVRGRAVAMLALALVAVLLSTGACSRAYEASDRVESTWAAEAPADASGNMGMRRQAASEQLARAEPAAPSGGIGGTGAPGQPPNLQQVQTSQPDRYLIKNGSISLEVEDARVAAQQVSATAVAAGGYTSSRTESLPAVGQRIVNIQIRVPADQFDKVIDQSAGLGKVAYQTMNTQEVTEEFVDTDARVRNLKKTEERVLGHLERATDLDEILKLENEITRIRGEIERMDGRLRYLQSRVEFSTIDVTLTERAKAQSIMPVQSWSLGKDFADAFRSLWSLIQGLLSIAAWLLVWAVVWVPLAIAVGYVVRRAIRENRKNEPPAPPPTPES